MARSSANPDATYRDMSVPLRMAEPHIARRERRTADTSAASKEHVNAVPMRRYDRIPVHVNAVLYRGRVSQFTVIRDISPAGARLVGAAGVFPGDIIEVALITGHSKRGKVRWWLNGSCGVLFDTPLAKDDPFILRALRNIRVVDAQVAGSDL